MFSFFNTRVEPTRFEKSLELKSIANSINNLKYKATELEAAKNTKGAASIDFKKYTIISSLLSEINTRIATFNASPQQTEHRDEMRDMLTLILEIATAVVATLRVDAETLNKFRNQQRENVNSVIGVSAFIAAASTLYIMPITWIPMLIGGPDIYRGIKSLTPTNDSDTKTMTILKELLLASNDTHLNLDHALNPDNVHTPIITYDPEEESDADEHEVNEDDESGLLFIYSPATEGYVHSIQNRQTIDEAIAAANLTAVELIELEKFHDPVLCSVMNIPVMLDETFFDLDTLLRLSIDDSGQRENPYTRHKFYLRDIQPARQVFNNILETISGLVHKRSVSESHTPSLLCPGNTA